MTNQEMAATLFKIATLLKEREENPYRIQAYENGARALMRRRANDLVAPLQEAEKTLPHPKGVLGDRLQTKLRELARTGQMAYFDELCADLPPYMGKLMRVSGIGPRLAQRLHDTLGIEDAKGLARAARSGCARQVWGVGPKRSDQWAQLSLFDEGFDGQPERLAA